MNSMVTINADALPEASSTSLSLPESLTFEEWEAIGAELANRAKKLNWWIGDWWAAGNHRYGDRARIAARGLFGKEFKTLANIASVCRAFEPTRRREDLSWSHHAEAAALSPAAADMLLDMAERDRMSKAQVRAAVSTIRGTTPRSDFDEAAIAGVFRAYNRLPEALRQRVARALAVAAESGAEIDPATGMPRQKIELDAAGDLVIADEPDAEFGSLDDVLEGTADFELEPAPALEEPLPIYEPEAREAPASDVPDDEPAAETEADALSEPAASSESSTFDSDAEPHESPEKPDAEKTPLSPIPSPWWSR